MPIVMISTRQIRAARALLGWTQADLAAKAGISLTTLNVIERDKSNPLSSSMNAIERALTGAGIVFLNSDAPGVRLMSRPRRPRDERAPARGQAQPGLWPHAS
jgi:DNA-binding XRE family transcriptional regulator